MMIILHTTNVGNKDGTQQAVRKLVNIDGGLDTLGSWTSFNFSVDFRELFVYSIVFYLIKSDLVFMVGVICMCHVFVCINNF